MIAKLSTDQNVKATWFEVSQISQSAIVFETALKTECAVMDAYYVVKKGIYSTKDLVENAHVQIPVSVRGKVPR
jgi:hypothetical protein